MEEQPQSLIHYRHESEVARMKEMRGLLDHLHDGLRSLAERIHETATAQIRTWHEKSDRALSSMRSHF